MYTAACPWGSSQEPRSPEVGDELGPHSRPCREEHRREAQGRVHMDHAPHPRGRDAEVRAGPREDPRPRGLCRQVEPPLRRVGHEHGGDEELRPDEERVRDVESRAVRRVVEPQGSDERPAAQRYVSSLQRL